MGMIIRDRSDEGDFSSQGPRRDPEPTPPSEIDLLRQDLADLTHLVMDLLNKQEKCRCGRDSMDYHPEDDCFATRTINRILRRDRARRK